MARMIQIDGEKLDSILHVNKLKKSHVSESMGYNDGFISHCVMRNQINVGAAKMLEKLYGITLDDYKYVEPPKPVEPEPQIEPEPAVEQTEIEALVEKPSIVPLDMEQLQKAVALAFDNMRTDYDALRGAVREGILDALVAALNDSDMRYRISSLLINAHLSALQLNLKKVREGNKK